MSEPRAGDASESVVASPAVKSSNGLSESRWLLVAERYGLVVLLVAATVVFAVIPESADTFATHANLNNILGGEVTLCVVAIAFTLPLMVGQLDLSVASIAGLARSIGELCRSSLRQSGMESALSFSDNGQDWA